MLVTYPERNVGKGSLSPEMACSRITLMSVCFPGVAGLVDESLWEIVFPLRNPANACWLLSFLD